jgi:hypothetical protein
MDRGRQKKTAPAVNYGGTAIRFTVVRAGLRLALARASEARGRRTSAVPGQVF